MTGSFDMGSEDTNSGPHIYTASTLQTEPSSQAHVSHPLPTALGLIQMGWLTHGPGEMLERQRNKNRRPQSKLPSSNEHKNLVSWSTKTYPLCRSEKRTRYTTQRPRQNSQRLLRNECYSWLQKLQRNTSIKMSQNVWLWLLEKNIWQIYHFKGKKSKVTKEQVGCRHWFCWNHRLQNKYLNT